MGWSVIPLLASAPYMVLIGWLGSSVGNSVIVDRIVWWIPFLLFGSLGSYLLTKRIAGGTVVLVLAPIIYIFNTYSLLLLSGGQIAGIGLAYAFAPFVILSYISVFEKSSIRKAITVAVTLSILLMFDLRITYVTLVGIGLYIGMQLFLRLELKGGAIKNKQALFKLILCSIIIPAGLVVMLHAYWLIAMVVVRDNPLVTLGPAYTSTNAIQFFSFAKFENAMGLLHPNWPANIFGKTYFMRPEFLVLPILAFFSLLFIQKPKDEKARRIRISLLFFALLALIGTFFAKGVNEPFGGIYIWMFLHVPGFVMFRDPTKWYLLIAISYSVLIPFSVSKMYEWMQKRKKFAIFNLHNALFVIILLYFLFLIHPALLGKLGGTLSVSIQPREYITLEKFLSNQHSFFRTMWIPSLERYGSHSTAHPTINAEEYYHTSEVSTLLTSVRASEEEQRLQERSIKYVIVPYDAEKEIFLKDRIFDVLLYQYMVQNLQKISWLHEVTGFGRIHVFEIKNPKDHIWVNNNSKSVVTYQIINPTKYAVRIENAIKGDVLIFSESYDKNWELVDGNKITSSYPYGESLNSFTLSKGGNYTVSLIYASQQWVDMGVAISFTTSFIVVASIILYSKKKIWR